jgi:hypothetical protein
MPVPGNRRHGERSVISAENKSAKTRMSVPIDQWRLDQEYRNGRTRFRTARSWLMADEGQRSS